MTSIAKYSENWIRTAFGRSVPGGRDVFGAAIFLLLIVSYLPVFSLYARQHWDATNLQGAYAHAPLIILLIAFLGWRNRAIFSAARPVATPVSGILVLACGAFLKIYGEIQGYVVLQGISLIPVLMGLLLTRYGTPVWRAMRFPVCLLVFVIPMPDAAIDALTQPLVMATADLATPILTGLQLEVARAGHVLTVNAPGVSELHEVVLAPECSGIRSFVALLALSSVYAYQRGHTAVRSLLLLLLTIPLAICGNAARVTLTILLIVLVGPDTAESFFHVYSGLLLFIVTLSGLLLADRLLHHSRIGTVI